jgi:hypothetical protein
VGLLRSVFPYLTEVGQGSCISSAIQLQKAHTDRPSGKTAHGNLPSVDNAQLRAKSVQVTRRAWGLAQFSGRISA